METNSTYKGYRRAQENLKMLTLSNYPLIAVVSDDEIPVVQTMKTIAERSSKNYEVYTWNSPGGLVKETGFDNKTEKMKPLEVINFIDQHQGNAIFILHDYHIVMQNNPDAILNLKEIVLRITKPMIPDTLLSRYKQHHNNLNKHIILTMPERYIPSELNKLMSIVDFGLPGVDEISYILDEIISNSKNPNNKRINGLEKQNIIKASQGLTETEIYNAISKSMLRNKGYIDYKSISEEKEQIIRKDGLLEYYPAKTDLNDIGGLRNLIEWVKKRKLAYNEEIKKQYNLATPKGLLMTGIQGCGKSHSVKAIANFLEMPLIRLDVGQLMNKWVGESESNIRKAIEVAESVSPAVLWIDEIDKVIPDPQSASSHETSKRMFSTLLTWLQEKEEPVFVVATANNIDHLPPELMRKGRFDEIFFIDLPNDDEQLEILSIHLKKKGYNPEDFFLKQLLPYVKGFSGSEIQVLIDEAIFQAAHKREQLQSHHLMTEAEQTNPLSKTMGDKIKKIQEWAKKNGIRPAS